MIKMVKIHPLACKGNSEKLKIIQKIQKSSKNSKNYSKNWKID